MARHVSILLSLGLLTLAVPQLSAQGNPKEQDQVIEIIKKLGGRVEFKHKEPGQSGLSALLVGSNITDAGLKNLRALVNLGEVDL